MRSTTLGLISLALERARAQPVFYDNYAVLTTNGATCTSAGLMPIASVSECETAVAAINAANGWSGYDFAYESEEHSCAFPSGCYSSCKSASAGYFCVSFNTWPDTSHGVGCTTTTVLGITTCRNVFCSSQPLQAPPVPNFVASPTPCAAGKEITSAAECDAAISEVNAAGGHRKRYDSVSTVSKWNHAKGCST